MGLSEIQKSLLVFVSRTTAGHKIQGLKNNA